MTRIRHSDEICALCDEFSVRHSDPEQANIGMGKCLARTDGKLMTHVGWNNSTCVSFRLDRPNLARRRQYVEKWRAKSQ